MKRNDADGFAPGGLYQEGAPGTGLLASKLGAKALNAWQEELAAVVTSAGLTLDPLNNGQLLQALGILFSAGNASAALKNRVINGAFELWQRGTSIAVANSTIFTADRWAAIADATGSGTATVSRQNFAIGQTNVPGGPKNYLRWSHTAASTSSPLLFQPIEDVARYSSGKITVSFWARCSATLNIGTRCIQVFGSGGSPAVTVGTQSLALTTTWTKYTATYTLPSVAGKTFGPINYLRVGITFPPALTFTADFAEFQVETGENSTAFDRRPGQLEYLFAARYFEKSYALGTDPGTLTRAGALGRFGGTSFVLAGAPMKRLQERFRVPKRGAPAITWYAPTGGTTPYDAGAGKVSFLGDTGASTPVLAAIAVTSTVETSTDWTGSPVHDDLTGYTPALFNFGSGAPGIAWAHWVADAEIL